jgi:hypothetical protein
MNKDEIKKIIENKEEVVEFKKSAIKFADVSISMSTEAMESINKDLSTSKDQDTDSVIKRTIIGNTYNWKDSHGDVHVGNTFKKSISERQTKIWHLADHEQKMTAKIGRPSKVYEKSVAWSDLGVSKTGNTTVVMMDSDIMKGYNATMFEQYKDDQVDQHSVGMMYVKMELAVNDPEYKEEFAEWNKHIDNLGNKAEAEKEGMFWAVYEAKLIEISAVLAGSNPITPTLEAKGEAKPDDTKEKNDNNNPYLV